MIRHHTPESSSVLDTAFLCATVTIAAVMASVSPSFGQSSVTWINQTNVTVISSALEKTAGSEGVGDGHATSQQQLTSGDGFVQFTALETVTTRYVGFTNGPTSSADSITFCINLWQNTAIIRETGFAILSVPAAPNDVFQIKIQAGVVSYFKNGTLLITSTKNVVYPLYVDAYVYSVRALVNNPTVSIAGNVQNVVWTNLLNTTAIGPALDKTGGADGIIDAHATSQQQIASGDGFLQFTAPETFTTRYVGLTNGPSSSPDNITFCINLWQNTAIIRENGFATFSVAAAAGDVFQIKIHTGLLGYYKNGNLLINSNKNVIYPLYVDAYPLSLNATIDKSLLATGNVTQTLTAPAGATQVTYSVDAGTATTIPCTGTCTLMFTISQTKLYSLQWTFKDAANNPVGATVTHKYQANGAGGPNADAGTIFAYIGSPDNFQTSTLYSDGILPANPNAPPTTPLNSRPVLSAGTSFPDPVLIGQAQNVYTNQGSFHEYVSPLLTCDAIEDRCLVHSLGGVYQIRTFPGGAFVGNASGNSGNTGLAVTGWWWNPSKVSPHIAWYWKQGTAELHKLDYDAGTDTLYWDLTALGVGALSNGGLGHGNPATVINGKQWTCAFTDPNFSAVTKVIAMNVDDKIAYVADYMAPHTTDLVNHTDPSGCGVVYDSASGKIWFASGMGTQPTGNGATWFGTVNLGTGNLDYDHRGAELSGPNTSDRICRPTSVECHGKQHAAVYIAPDGQPHWIVADSYGFVGPDLTYVDSLLVAQPPQFHASKKIVFTIMRADDPAGGWTGPPPNYPNNHSMHHSCAQQAATPQCVFEVQSDPGSVGRNPTDLTSAFPALPHHNRIGAYDPVAGVIRWIATPDSVTWTTDDYWPTNRVSCLSNFSCAKAIFSTNFGHTPISGPGDTVQSVWVTTGF